MSTSSTTGRRILVVDNEPLVCDSVRMILELDGHAAQAASSGEDALALLGKASFDLVIIDYGLPGMKGDKLAAAIKALDPNKPILLITGYAELLQASHAPLPGVDFAISKPFDVQQLRKAVAELLKTQGCSDATAGH